MRKILLLALLLLVIALPLSVQAQDNPLCGDLAVEDCALLTEASANNAALESARLDIFVRLIAENVPDFNERMSVTVAGYVGYSVPTDEVLPALSGLDPEEQADILATALNDLQVSIDVTARIEDGRDVQNIPIQFQVSDAITYVSVDSAAALSASSMSGGWIGIELEAFLRLMGEMQPEIYDDLDLGIGTGGINFNLLSRFAEVTRLTSPNPDEAVFETRINVGDALLDPPLRRVLRAQLGESPTEFRWTIQNWQFFLGDSELVIRQVVGLEDQFLHSVSIRYELEPTSLEQTAIFGRSPDAEPLQFSLEYEVNYSNFDEPLELAAPDDVIAIFNYPLLKGCSTATGS